MAKSYIDIVKYVIEAKFDIDGTVEKPDIIGAIFGQTEGLLGEDLDLRDLQKNGKIGRIEIESSSNSGKTSGTLILPSSLDRVETCILGAAIESVDRVGPYETNFKVLKIEDTRNEKRAHVINRAKDLLKSLMENVIPDSKEISDMVESEVKSSTVINYGPENLPAGPDIDKSSSIIIVEGRADVVNLLRSDIANAIAVGGATTDIPKSLIKLASEKEVTVFTDGDHGGTMIVKNIASVADVDYVARAPDGKEVEELTRKEIIKALRSKIPIEQAAVIYKISLPDSNQSVNKGNGKESTNGNYSRDKQKFKGNHYSQYTKSAEPQEQKRQFKEPEQQVSIIENNTAAETTKEQLSINKEVESNPIKKEVEEEVAKLASEKQPLMRKQVAKEDKEKPVEPIEKTKLKPDDGMIASLSELKNTLRGRIYGPDKKLIAEVPIRELIQSIQDIDNIESIVFDGIITQRLVDLANKKNVKSIYGVRSSQIARKYGSMLLYTSDDI